MTDPPTSHPIASWIKLGVLVIFVLGSAIAMQFTDLSTAFDDIRQWLSQDLGAWGPVAFVLLYALLIALTLPGTVVTVFGATVFGLFKAFFLVLIGAMLGASVSFALGRFLGRDATELLLGKSDNIVLKRIASAAEHLENRGVLTVAYLRMAYVPFVVLNYLAPLTGIRFRDFFVGTFLGILPGTFVFVFMGNTLGQAWDTGEWAGLLIWKTPVAIGLFLVSLTLPWIVQRVISSRSSE